jgi:hypothetical protein
MNTNWFEHEDKSLEELIELGVDIHSVNSSGETLLTLSAQLGHEKTVKRLLQIQADVNHQDFSGDTALWNAVWNETSISLISTLLEYKADPYINIRSSTVLHCAAGMGLHYVHPFLKHGVAWDIKNENGWTPIHEAALNCQHEVLECFADLGYDMDIRTNLNWSPFHISILKTPLIDNLRSVFIEYRSSHPIPEIFQGSALYSRPRMELLDLQEFLQIFPTLNIPESEVEFVMELCLDVLWSPQTPQLGHWNVEGIEILVDFVFEHQKQVRLGFLILNALFYFGSSYSRGERYHAFRQYTSMKIKSCDLSQLALQLLMTVPEESDFFLVSSLERIAATLCDNFKSLITSFFLENYLHPDWKVQRAAIIAALLAGTVISTKPHEVSQGFEFRF